MVSRSLLSQQNSVSVVENQTCFRMQVYDQLTIIVCVCVTSFILHYLNGVLFKRIRAIPNKTTVGFIERLA